jgi:hypothetical protein
VRSTLLHAPRTGTLEKEREVDDQPLFKKLQTVKVLQK